MADLLLGAAAFILATVGVGLWRILRGPTEADRMMAAQLIGTGGIAVLLLVGGAAGIDVALCLALLAALASIVFALAADR